MATILRHKWKWFGNAGHLCVARWCQFHLCTRVGKYLVSTVGQYVPDEGTREVIAQVRKVELVGRGDDRLADYMCKIGYQEVGLSRTFESMVFNAGKTCIAVGCNCGMPTIDGSELDMQGYQEAGAATKGHLKLCQKWAAKQ